MFILTENNKVALKTKYIEAVRIRTGGQFVQIVANLNGNTIEEFVLMDIGKYEDERTMNRLLEIAKTELKEIINNLEIGEIENE